MTRTAPREPRGVLLGGLAVLVALWLGLTAPADSPVAPAGPVPPMGSVGSVGSAGSAAPLGSAAP